VTGLTGPNSQPPAAPRPRRVKLATNLGAWLVAWATVFGPLGSFGGQLASLPLPIRALVISGVLVALMTNLVMPFLGRLLRRWVG
jgi:antibiotic biosynthesis monooxygenase (ABM) superfamily enzyme